VVSLALGLYQTFRPGATDKVEWVEGVAILVAITIVTVVQSVNDYQKERQFMKLNQKVISAFTGLIVAERRPKCQGNSRLQDKTIECLRYCRRGHPAPRAWRYDPGGWRST